MMKFLGRLLKLVLILVVIVVGGALAAFYFLPSDWIEGRVAAAVKEETGRDLAIDGEIERGLYPLTLKLTGVTLSNAEWASDAPMVEAKTASVRVSTMPLLFGEIEVEELILEEPIIRLARSATGEENWAIGGSDRQRGGKRGGGGAGDACPGGPDLILKDARISGGQVYFDDQAAGASYEIIDLNVTAALPSPKAALEVSGSAQIDGRPATLSANVDTLDALMSCQPAKAGLAFDTAGMKVAFNGEAAQGGESGPVAKGALKIDFDGDAPETAWLRALLPPDYSEIGKTAIQGDFDYSAAGVDADFTVNAAFKGRPLTFAATTQAGPNWTSGGEPVTLKLDAASEGLFSLNWNGSITTADDGMAQFSGDFAFSTEEIRGFAEWIGAPPLDLPEDAFRTAAIKMGVAFDGETATLQGIDIKLDDTGVAGDITVAASPGERPKVTARLAAQPLDVRRFLPKAQSGAAASGAPASSGGSGWSDAPLQLDALKLLDADLRVETAEMITPVVRFSDAVLTATLENGKLVFSVERMTLYDGAATAQLTIDANGAPKMTAVADIGGVALRPFLRDAAAMDWLEGTGTFKADLAASGRSVKAMMEALGGTAAIDLSDGAIIGYNLAALVRNITTLGASSEDEQKTDFASITASFVIKDGVAANDDLQMQGPLLRMTGAGTIDIGRRTVNYRAEPKAVATLEGQGGAGDLSGLTFPILITGSWDNPSVEPDLAGGALESVEGILANPDQLGDALTDALGGGDEGGGLGGVVDGVLGGGEGESSDGGLGGVVDGVLGGGGDDEGSSGGGVPGLPGGLFGD